MERAPLAEARYEKKWSLEKVAALAEVDRTTVLRWEKGTSIPQPANLRRLCQIFGKSAQELGFSEEEDGQDTDSPLSQESPLPLIREGDEDDAYIVFRNQHYFLRLVRMVWNWPSHKGYDELQALVLLESELEGNDMDLTRRDALRLLASLPIEMGAISALSSSSSKQPNEDLLAPCAAGITACWQLRRGHELAFVSSTVSKYIPTLKAIVSNSSDGKKRKAAASLLVQCYVLKSLLAVHLESNAAALRYVKLAESFVGQSQNRALQVLVAKIEANAHDYAGSKKQALLAGKKAKHLLETNKEAPIHPLMASNIYAGLANYQAQNGQEEDALTSLLKAHTTFAADSDESAPIWVTHVHGKGNLLIHDGLVHYYLGFHDKASSSFEQINAVQDCSETTRIEALIDQVWAEVMHENGRDMERCIALWKGGMTSAISIQSQAQYDDAMGAYTAMRAAWPSEMKIKELKDYAVHW